MKEGRNLIDVGWWCSWRFLSYKLYSAQNEFTPEIRAIKLVAIFHPFIWSRVRVGANPILYFESKIV